TAFVGRERELAAVEGLLEEALSEPAARAIVITGAAGTGKSRLLAELFRRAAERGEDGWQRWHAQGDATRSESSFAMLGQLVRHAAGIEAGDSPPRRQARLAQRLADGLPPADAERAGWFLAELVGAPHLVAVSAELAAARQDPMLMGDQMRRAFEDWLGGECARAPVLLVLEDLHVADPPSVRFVDAALRHLRHRPFAVLALGRPEGLRRFPNLFAERALQELRLGELGKRACERVARLALGAVASDTLVARLAERSGGNAFYLEELVRAVASGQREDSLPGTVLAMVQARLEALDAPARRVLRAASVFGQSFRLAGIEALLGEHGHDVAVRAILSELVELELLVPSGGLRGARDEELAFRQDLLREAAYATLTDADRVLGHRLAAEWLETGGDAEPATLAGHYARGAEPERASEWYGRAADLALEGNDFPAVVELAERALSMGASPSAAGRARLRQAEAQRWMGAFVDAERLGLEAIALLSPGSDGWLCAVGEMATVLGKFGSAERLATLGRSLLDEARSVEPRAEEALATALSRASTALLMMSEAELSEALFRELERIVGDASRASPSTAAWWLRALAFRAPFRGEIGVCAGHFAASADRFAEAGDLRNACLQRANAGASYLEVGAYSEAERTLRHAIAEAERMGARHIVGSAERDLGCALSRMGRLDEARTVEERAVAELRAHGDRRLEGLGRDELATILLALGDEVGAEREARAAVELLAAAKPYRSHAQATLARVLLARGEPSEALEHAEQALALLREVGSLEEGEGLVRLVLAQTLRALARDDEAWQLLTEAEREGERRAALVTDLEARRTFLEAIPEHVETRALAAAWALERGRRATEPPR
ncbi:MAG: AAA family ATPase, partial [Polyangiaceae bacterium]|nr:AAA family ATPase [Polyangiaceae bacterium]